jgi:two-component system nitrate/nitrite response regulator NarL
MTIRLVIADDHHIVLDGLVKLFSGEHDFECVASVSNGQQALAAVRQHRPDVLVLDLRMPGKDGLWVLREMHADAMPTRTVVLTAMDGDELLEAVGLGVRGIVLKEAATKVLVQCIREVYSGGIWLEKSFATQAVNKLLRREAGTRSIAQKLTPREIEVARMIVHGLPNKVIANKLSISEGTAKLHLHHVYEKLNLNGRMALLRYLRIHGIE